jgi:hypothetical protein
MGEMTIIFERATDAQENSLGCYGRGCAGGN